MARSAPFQLPRTRSTIAATLQRLAGGGKPALTPFVAPQNPTTVTPYKGDPAHYGEGPEWDFFQTPAPPPPPAKPPTTGGGSGGGGGNSGGGFDSGIPPDVAKAHPQLNDYLNQTGTKFVPFPAGQTQNPWKVNGGGNQAAGGNGNTGQGGIATGPITGLGKQLGGTGNPVTHQMDPSVVDGGGINTGPITGLGKELGVQTPGLPQALPPQNPDAQVQSASKWGLGGGQQQPAPQPHEVLASLGVSPQVTGVPHQPAVMPQQQPAPSALPSYLQSLGAQTKATPRTQPRTGSGSPRNMAVGGAVDPGGMDSAAQAIASLRQAPLDQRGEQDQGGIGQNKTGQDMANADVAVNPSLKSALSIGSMIAGMAMSPAVGAIMSAAKLGIGALTGNPMASPFDVPGPRLTADQLQQAQDAYNQNLGPGTVVTNALAAYNKSIENSRTVDRGGQIGGAGPGLSAGVGVDSAGHEYASNIGGGGVSHNLAGGNGGSDGGGAPDGGGRIGSDTGGQGARAGFYNGGRIRNLAKGGLPRFPSIRRFADGGAMSPGNQFADASSQSMAQPMPAVADSTGSAGFSAQLLPFLAGSFGSQTAGPYAGAASLGAATAMLGGTMQDAMNSATLLYQSGAAQQPHAQRREFDPSRTQTTAVLQQLAQQTGVANQLRASAADPSAVMAASHPAMGYSKPTPRKQMADGGGLPESHTDGSPVHQGPGAVAGPGGGHDDLIPAMLADGEFVMSSQDVSDFGDGSNAEGARKLEQFRQLIRKNAGRRNVTSIAKKQPPVESILKRMAGGRA